MNDKYCGAEDIRSESLEALDEVRAEEFDRTYDAAQERPDGEDIWKMFGG